MPGRMAALAGAVALVAATVVAGPAGAAQAAAGSAGHGPVVRTDAGLLRGRSAEAVDQWLGVPYAAPPVGARRWRAPAPVRPWHGVRAATSYGSRCAQLASGNGPRVDNEDCLYLNVFRPAHTGHRRLPVLFMIHGGGLANGAGDQHDGSLIARTDHIMVVSINYRLGPFGFLDVPGLSRTGAGDYGLLDQIAALNWVHRDIAAFGGDPRRVTIAGESAGGFSVCALMASPRTRGRFDKVIMESGSCVSQSPATARATGAAFAKAVGCSDAACLRAKPERELLDAAADFSPMFTRGGAELPRDPYAAVRSGRFTNVPILLGSNHDEGRTFAQGFAHDTKAQYEAFIRGTEGAHADAVLAHYPFGAYPSPYTAAYAIGAVMTDSGSVGGIGGCATRRLATVFAHRQRRTYAYQFDDRHAPGLNRDLPGYRWGAGHAMELAYLWPSFNNGYSLYDLLTPAQRELSRDMVHYWGAFVKRADPNVVGQAHWPQYRAGAFLSLRPGGDSTRLPDRAYARQHQCAFWDSIS